MKTKTFVRTISLLLSLLLVSSCLLLFPMTANAAALPDNYEDEFDAQGKTYQSLGILEDQYDLIEPVNNRYPIVSPSSDYDASYPPLFTGTYEQVEAYLKEHKMTDGLPVVPPTKIKAEKYMGYSSYQFNDVVATVNGKPVKAYQVAANAIMAGCAPEHLPVCMAFAEALGNSGYLDSLRSGKLTPMLYVNGPMARQIGIDNAQGMTTEEANIGIGRFMELALINLAGIDRTNAFGNVQPLVFSENEEACLNIGWDPHHVEKGYELNSNVATAASFAMWGNNVTPATDLPDEIMKVLAWDVTEKNLGGLGSASVQDNAGTKRLIFITEAVAAALSAKYKTKGDLENALVENARRPLWMRTYAYYYANTGGALSKSFSDVYAELKSAKAEDAKTTASPAWMNGITYANIDTVATMQKGNTDIIITGDGSRNKTQVMPGGVAVTKDIKLSSTWNTLTTGMNYNPIENFYLSKQTHAITPPSAVPSVLTNGTYRILDPTSGATYLTRAGRVYFDAQTNTLYYYAQGKSASASAVLDPVADADFISYLTLLGYNSSFTVNNGKIKDVTIRFSSNNSKLHNNTVALTAESFSGIPVTLHANNTSNSNAAGGLAKDGATITLSDTVTGFGVNLDGDIVMGDATNADFIKLSGTAVTVNPTVEAGATAVIGASNSNGTYRTMTFVNGGDGTVSVTYNTAGTLSNTTSSVYLKGTFNNWEATDAFEKTGNSDVISLTKEIPAGSYELKLHKLGTDDWYGKDSAIADSVNRLTMTKNGGNCAFTATGGKYEFKYELSTNKLSVYYADNRAMDDQPTAPPTEPTTAPEVTCLLGDVNRDGRITVKDVASIQRHCAEVNLLSGMALTAADVNGDGVINIGDATCIQMYLAEFESGFGNCGQTVTVTEPVTEAPPTQAPTEATAPATTAKPTQATQATTQAQRKVTLNASKTSTGTELWYAWTWNGTEEGTWIKGSGTSASNITFTGVKNSIIFVRMNPSGNVPSWDAKWNQTTDLTTQVGKTFITSGWDGDYMLGSWS